MQLSISTANTFATEIANIRDAIGNALEYRGSATASADLAGAIDKAEKRLTAASEKRVRSAGYLASDESRKLDATYRAADFTTAMLASAIGYAKTVQGDTQTGRKAKRSWFARLVG